MKSCILNIPSCRLVPIMAFRSIPVESTKYDYASSGGFIVPANRIATQDDNRHLTEAEGILFW